MKIWILYILINILSIIAIVTVAVTHHKEVSSLEYNHKDLNRKINLLQTRIKYLEDHQDVRFLRLVNEATFYKGNDVEVWRILPKKDNTK